MSITISVSKEQRGRVSASEFIEALPLGAVFTYDELGKDLFFQKIDATFPLTCKYLVLRLNTHEVFRPSAFASVYITNPRYWKSLEIKLSEEGATL